jgi:hypothetical protein
MRTAPSAPRSTPKLTLKGYHPIGAEPPYLTMRPIINKMVARTVQ